MRKMPVNRVHCQSAPELMDLGPRSHEVGEDLSVYDIAQSIVVETATDHVGEGVYFAVGPEQTEYVRLADIHTLVNWVDSRLDDKAFVVTIDETDKKVVVPTSLGKHCQFVLCGFTRSSISCQSRRFRYSENIELFLDTCQRVGFPIRQQRCDELVDLSQDSEGVLGKFEGMTVGEAINEFVSTLREGLKSKSFRVRRAERKRQASRNFREACEYVDAHFRINARLLAVRVDLHFKEDELRRLTYLEVGNFVKRFLNNFRHHRFGREVVGYVRKLEDGHSRGPHVHLLLFFSGREHKQHAFIAEEVGKYWQHTTHGIGYYFSCHRNSSAYHFPALGMIHRDDLQKRRNLIKIVRYLTKSDQFMKVIGFRSFEKGRTPELRVPKRGRPTKKSREIVASD